MEDFKWKNGVRKDKWCVYFCGPLWALRDSRGRGPPEWWPDFDKALEDLEVIFTEAQSILSSRLPAETAEELQQMKSANESLKLQVVQMEEKFEKLQQDTLKFREVFDGQQKMKDELAQLKLDNSKMKEMLTDLKSENDRLKGNEAEFDQNVSQLEQDVLNTKKLNEKQQGELLATKEELRQLKEELQEWKEEKESVKSQGLEVDRKVIQLEESNTLLSKQLHDQLQKLEDERLIMKEDRLKMKEQVMELKSQMNREKSKLEDELQELSSNYGHLKQWKLKAIKADVSDVCSELSSWVQGHQDAESSMLHSASSAFSIANGPRCFMLDAVFKTPRETFIDGAHLCLGLWSVTRILLFLPTIKCSKDEELITHWAPSMRFMAIFCFKAQRNKDPCSWRLHHPRGCSPSRTALCTGHCAPSGSGGQVASDTWSSSRFGRWSPCTSSKPFLIDLSETFWQTWV